MDLLPPRLGPALRTDPAALDIVVYHGVQLGLGVVADLHGDEGVKQPPSFLPQQVEGKMTVVVRHHLSLHPDVPSVPRWRLVFDVLKVNMGNLKLQIITLDNLNDRPRAGRGDDNCVFVIILEKLLNVSGNSAFINLDATADPVGVGIEGTCLPHGPVFVDEGLLGEQRIDTITDYHQLTVALIAIQLQFSDKYYLCFKYDSFFLVAEMF